MAAHGVRFLFIINFPKLFPVAFVDSSSKLRVIISVPFPVGKKILRQRVDVFKTIKLNFFSVIKIKMMIIITKIVIEC